MLDFIVLSYMFQYIYILNNTFYASKNPCAVLYKNAFEKKGGGQNINLKIKVIETLKS